MKFLSVVTTILCFLFLCYIYWAIAMNPGRRDQKKSSPKNPTMFDVRRFLKEGDKDAAIRCYSQIFKVSPKQARKDIEELERSLKV